MGSEAKGMTVDDRPVPSLMPRNVYEDWLATLPADVCTFCEWDSYQVVLLSTDHWLWILNRAPYWRFHTMFVPKEHRVQMSELSVVEVGELFRIYEDAVAVLGQLQERLPEPQRISKYLFFWRLRDEYREKTTGRRKLAHFHLHLAPDREGLFDPLLDENAHAVDYIPLMNLAANYRVRLDSRASKRDTS